MNILVFGGNGMVGRRIVGEASQRGHQVTIASRNTTGVVAPASVKVEALDVTDSAAIRNAASGKDVVISAVGPALDGDPAIVEKAAESLVDALQGVPNLRLVIVGGAGGLQVAPGVRLIDAPEFPSEWKPIAQAHIDALDVYNKADQLAWTYIAPSAMIAPGERTGKYRRGTDTLLTDAEGNSHISAEDYAVGFMDEVEHQIPTTGRITLGY